MSQEIKILKILEDQGWHCTNEFYASYIADPRSRLSALKRKGYDLQWRWCKQHNHNKSKEWKLNVNQQIRTEDTKSPIPRNYNGKVPQTLSEMRGYPTFADFTH